MKASETSLQPVLEGTKQYVIPLFQRAYRWKRKDWETLWDDLMDLYADATGREHFMGAIVTMPVEMSPHGINKFVLIDGQQRLTTLFLILALIRDQAKATDPRLAEQINELYLVNKWETDVNYYKLLPTHVDREPYFELISGKPVRDGRLAGAAEFFRRRLAGPGPDQQPIDIQQLQKTILQRLVLVGIVLAKDENPYLIFESLNGKGQPLTEADLVRNYIFMNIEAEHDQQIAYKDLWLPMERRLNDNVTPFFWRFLTKDGTFIRQNAIYDAFKARLARLDSAQIIDELLELHVYSTYYQRLIAPAEEPNPEIRRRLTRLNRWEVNTAYPFLLALYNDYEHGRLTATDFCRMLDIIESYVIRRFFCRIPTNALNRIFIALYNSLDPQHWVASLEAQLLVRNWPTDDEFLAGWQRFPIYSSGTTKCRHILETLEAQISSNHEPVDLTYPRITIEHIMPQTLNEQWESDLGTEAATTHNALLHAIGNLTLTGMNEPMGNAAYAYKQKTLAKSNFALNRYFATCDKWDGLAIQTRASVLFPVAMNFWKRPEGGAAANRGDDPTGHKPTHYRLFAKEYPATAWRDVLLGVAGSLAKHHGESFAIFATSLQGTKRQYVAPSPDDMNNPAPIEGTKLWIETNFSSKDVIRIAKQLVVVCGHDERDFEAFW